MHHPTYTYGIIRLLYAYILYYGDNKIQQRMIDVYRKYEHCTDLTVMFNCRSNNQSGIKINSNTSGGGLKLYPCCLYLKLSVWFKIKRGKSDADKYFCLSPYAIMTEGNRRHLLFLKIHE